MAHGKGSRARNTQCMSGYERENQESSLSRVVVRNGKLDQMCVGLGDIGM